MEFNNFLFKKYIFAKVGLEVGYKIYSMGKTPIIIYTMGKVGSTSVLNSLKDYFPHDPVFHIHVLSDEGIIRAENGYFGAKIHKFDNSKLPETIGLYQAFYLHRELKHKIDKKWKVITLVRDPVARNISAFFHDLYAQMPNFPTEYASGLFSVNELQARFLTQYNYHEVPLNWFDMEMKKTLGLDVFNSSFPQQKGYKIYDTDIADVLVLRTSNINSSLQPALEDLLNLKHIQLSQSNISSESLYATPYKDFLRTVQLPDPYINKMYSSKYMNHFFTPEEIMEYTKRWLSNRNGV